MGAWLCKASPASSTPPGPADWSALPLDLVDLVLRCLPSLADRVRFASACRHWRHALRHYSLPSLPRPLPWLNFPDGSFRSLPDGELHSLRFRMLINKDTLCVGCSGNWLLFQDYMYRPSRYYLKNPLRGATMRLPEHCREPVHLNPDGSYGRRSSSRSTDFRIRKVIICSRDLVVAKANYQCHPRAVVVCCKPSTSSTWSTGLCNGLWYQDMAFYGEKIYTVTIEGDLFAHEVSAGGTDTEEEPTISRMGRVIQATQTQRLNYARCYLVISCTGKLLMVRWIVAREEPTTFNVFAADFRMSRWLEVESLGDEVLFVSSTCSRAIAASSHLQGNQIYFLDDSLEFWLFGERGNGPTCGVFDVSSSTIRPIPLGAQRHLSLQSKALWFFP